MITRTCIKSRKLFLFRFRRWEILKRQNYAKKKRASEICNSPFGSNRKISKTQRIILTLNYFQHLLHIHWNAFPSFIPCVSNALRIRWQLRNGSGLHRVTFLGISFINIRCQSRLEGNNR